MLNDRLTGGHKFTSYGLFPDFLTEEYAYLSPGAKLLYFFIVNNCIEDSLGYMYSKGNKAMYKELLGLTAIDRYQTELLNVNLLEIERIAGSKEIIYYPLVPKLPKKKREKIKCI